MADNFPFEKTGLLRAITFNRPERRNCLDEAIVLEAVRGAEFWVPEVELGMPFRGYPADVLAARMGPWMAREAIILCRHFTAEELHAARILNRVARLSDRASRKP